jgi:predicted TIM-barrel fold metal-dependent hydrolase
MVITDSQVHVWEAHSAERPWDPDEAHTPIFISVPGAHPHRAEPISAQEMNGMMDAAGVTRAVIVPPSPTGDDNLAALEAAAAYPLRYTVMGRFNPTAPDARLRLQSWLQQPGMSGIRMTFHKPKWGPWLDDGTIDWFWRDCEQLGIPLMLLIPGRMDAVARVAQRHPRLKLIIDHMGRRSQLRDDACFADLEEMLALATYRNVYIKTSSAACYTTEAYPYANLTPYLRRIFDSFGPQRCFWGSDVSRLPDSYKACVDHFLHELDFLKGDDKALVMGRALSNALDWPEPTEI